jgi:hypothetical protein
MNRLLTLVSSLLPSPGSAPELWAMCVTLVAPIRVMRGWMGCGAVGTQRHAHKAQAQGAHAGVPG